MRDIQIKLEVGDKKIRRALNRLSRKIFIFRIKKVFFDFMNGYLFRP